MAIASIGLGSNMPYKGLTPAKVLSVAVEQLAQAGRVLACSSLYATDPVGYAGQPAFLNAAVALDTSLLPLALLEQLLRTERTFGRDRSAGIRNGPRTLDLDLLLYDDLILDSEQLTLPHPRLADRRFVLAPLAEIAPAYLHPQLGVSLQQLFTQLPAAGENGIDAVRRMPASGCFPTLRA
jgi:2-amino-4-hydroxy-6-hydroxymethyldihydropteridine diphosphokinase